MADPRGGHMGHGPSLGVRGAPQACQGHHRPSRGTTGLAGAPRACQGHPRLVRGTTGLSGPRGTTDHRPVGAQEHQSLAGAPQA